ncbi:hypothetical protein [Aquimarina algiphila]|uniref:hypothetical protein n=1 Tax=Aquimarina algiphila TaxID=2047982 RepID=UPI002491D7FC|nr:hypothetical protein [Aquimarina algiphila]
MKNYLFILAAFFCILMNAQQTPASSPVEFNQTTNKILLNQFVRTALKNTVSEESINGNKYYEEDYRVANIFVDDVVIGEYPVRYNGFHDEIEVMEGNKVSALLPKKNVKVVFDEYIYKTLNDDVDARKKSYFIDFQNGKNVSLILKARKKIKRAAQPHSGLGGSIPANFYEDYKYYIKDKNGDLTKIKLKKKEVLAVLKDKKTEIEKFASSKKLSFKKKEDLIKIIDYYNTL